MNLIKLSEHPKFYQKWVFSHGDMTGDIYLQYCGYKSAKYIPNLHSWELNDNDYLMFILKW